MTLDLDNVHEPNRKRGLSEHSRTRRKTPRNADYLPKHVGEAFQSELVQLIAGLAENGGFKEKYLQSELLSKYCDAGTTPPDVRANAALNKWLSTEDRNSRTNQRIQLYAGDTDFGYGVTSEGLISFARKRIKAVLGELKPEILAGSSHTNGASTRIRRSTIAAAEKLTGTAHISTSAREHWYNVSGNTRLEDQALVTQESSVLFTVPKSSDIDRVACKEPEINMFLQRSVGNHIRRRLRRFGIDLNDQTINQNLARDALRLGLATIDLSSASDSITRQLVFELLPFEWWSLLEDIRVKSVILPCGATHHLEMFSSMGNGFTFELESLIFWALTQAIAYKTGTRGRISVYGDDIICPSAIAPFLAQIFGWFGFKVNSKKSNWNGLFRESCGKHYYNSWDVSPFYIREPVTSKTGLIRLLNRLLEWDGRGFGFIISPEVLSFHMKWAESVPRRLWGGIDPERIDSLVTGDAPRDRLLRLAKEVNRPENGALNHWFVVKEGSGSSRLSYDLGPWQYPPCESERCDENHAFSVDCKVLTKHVYALNTVFSDKETGRLYGERTMWSPWLNAEAAAQWTSIA